MTREHAGKPVLPPGTYQWVDRMTKLVGVVLVAAGLEVGGGSLPGITLGVAGAAVAVCTVFLEVETEPDSDSASDRDHDSNHDQTEIYE